MAGRGAGLCCSFQHSLVYGRVVCFCHDGKILLTHCVLWLSQLSSALCWRCLCGFGQERQGWCSTPCKNGQLVGRLKDGATWNNMYGWLAENTCRGAGRLLLDGSLHFQAFPHGRIAKEGWQQVLRGSGWMLLHVRAFGFVSRLALASFISQLVWSKAFMGGAFASADRSPVTFA